MFGFLTITLYKSSRIQYFEVKVDLMKHLLPITDNTSWSDSESEQLNLNIIIQYTYSNMKGRQLIYASSYFGIPLSIMTQ